MLLIDIGVLTQRVRSSLMSIKTTNSSQGAKRHSAAVSMRASIARRDSIDHPQLAINSSLG